MLGQVEDFEPLQRPVTAVIVVGAAIAALGPAEIGQQVGVGPAAEAGLRPAVVVAGMAADIDHAVDRGRAAEHAAARAIHHAAVHEGLGLGVVVPVDLVVGQRIGEGGRHVDLPVPGVIAAAGLEQKHASRWLGRQPVGQHAAGRAGADDDVIPVLAVRHPSDPQAAAGPVRGSSRPDTPAVVVTGT